jgi:hypothetical protein
MRRKKLSFDLTKVTVFTLQNHHLTLLLMRFHVFSKCFKFTSLASYFFEKTKVCMFIVIFIWNLLFTSVLKINTAYYQRFEKITNERNLNFLKYSFTIWTFSPILWQNSSFFLIINPCIDTSSTKMWKTSIWSTAHWFPNDIQTNPTFIIANLQRRWSISTLLYIIFFSGIENNYCY